MDRFLTRENVTAVCEWCDCGTAVDMSRSRDPLFTRPLKWFRDIWICRACILSHGFRVTREWDWCEDGTRRVIVEK